MAATAATQAQYATEPGVEAPLTAGNIVVYRIGDGAGPLVDTGVPVFLDEYTPTGTLIQSIAMPVSQNGNNRALFASGTSTAEGLITRSTDGQYLLLTGYASTYSTSVSKTTGTVVNRVVGRVDAAGNIDTTTALDDFASGNSPRSATSHNGTDLWIAGGAGGVRYTTLGATKSTQISTDLTNNRQVNIFDGQLYASDQSGSTYRLSTVGVGLPTIAGQVYTNLPGLPTSTGSPYGFFFADLDETVAGVDTLYLADDAAGIQKYSLVSGTWTINGTISGGGYRGLTGTVSGTTVTLFTISNTSVATVQDTSGYNAPFSVTSLTSLTTAATNTAFRGVALAPESAVDNPPSVLSTVPADTATDVAVSSNITVSFSEAVSTSSAAFVLECGSAAQAFTFSGSGASYTIDPDNYLPLATICTLTISASGVTDLDGTPDPMAADYPMSFTTTADVSPTVINTIPANNATNIAVGIDLSVTFSENVTTTGGAFALECGGVPQSFAFSGSDSSYSLNPDNNLPYSQTCSVTITASGVTDLDGTVDAMATDYSWVFTTTNDPTVVTPIAVARAAGAGWNGTLQGNVTLLPGLFANKSIAIQDATGGIYAYPASTFSLPALALGDVVQVRGTIKNYKGLLEIDPVTSVTWISTGSVPAPQVVATNSVAPTQGKLIQVQGTLTLPGIVPAPGNNYTFYVNDGSGQLTAYDYKMTNIDMRGFADGQQIRIIGLSMHYDAPQIQPRTQADLIDLRAPVVFSTVPAADATGASLYAPVSATFTKALDPATLTTGSFSLSGPSGAVSGAVSYDAAARTAVFTPTAALEPQSAYTATLNMAVEDIYGVPLAADYTWSFTTGDVDSVAPTIEARVPVPDAVDVSASAQVVVTFNEALSTASLDLAHFVLTGPYGVVPAALSYDPAIYTVTLTPSVPLLYSTEYTVTVTGTTADVAGNPLEAEDTWTFTTMVEPEMQTYFGDLHNHTSISDGSGTPAQALAAGKAAGFDFMAISDHSYAISDSEWADTLSAVEAATGTDFVGLRGFEYTQGAEGHINVWNSTRHATRTNVAGCTMCDYTPNLEAGSTVQGFYPWLVSPDNTSLDAAGEVMQFNHPGWINFNDWKYHPEVSGIARLEEVGNGNGTSYVFSEEEFIRSLDYGWKVGATNNADTHSDRWGVNTDHRTGVLMPELTKAALLEALRARRTFATEDKNASLSMKANGAWMGAEIANTGTISFEIAGTDPDGELASLVELITDQGKTLDSTVPTGASFTWQPEINISTGVHYFYVKVTQADGDYIVTSPVWAMGSEDISITDITIQPTIPTIYSPSLLSVRVTNRVAEPRTVTVSLAVNEVPQGAAKEVTVAGNADGIVYFDWSPSVVGPANVVASLGGAPAGDNPDDNTAALTLNVTDEHLPLILIDAGHGNMNTAGDEMKAFINDLSDHKFNVLKNLDTLTAADLDPAVVKLLIITAPQNAYTPEEQTAIANFVAAGGSLWMGGLADYTGKVPWAATVADRENAVLDTIATVTGQPVNMRMNDDEVIDGNTHNGYVFGVIWQDFPGAAATGIGLNVESVATWSLNSIVDGNKQALTVDDAGVQILMQGDMETGCTADTHQNPLRTSNTDADGAGDAYIYNLSWTCVMDVPPIDAVRVPGAAAVELANGAGRILLYGDSNDPFTTFAYTAGDGKQNELFNLQSVMWLLGEPLQKSTIAEARAQAVEDQPDKLDQLVWVEGEITAAYGEFFNVLYVQDETGGITVHAPAGDIDASAFTRGTHVRAIGTIGIYNGDTEIEFFEAEMVQVIPPTAYDAVPLALTTAQAALEANEGWLTVVTGIVTGKTGTDTLIVDDGSGPVRIFLDGYNGSFEDILLNDSVQATGLASEDGDGQRMRVRNYKADGIPDDVIVLNHAPVAADQTLTTAEDTALAGTLTATDADSDALTYAEGTAPAHGTLSITAATGAFTYTPAADYNGPDSFTFTASDGTLSDIGTITLTVTPVNDAPVAADQTLTTAEDTALTGTLTATDADSDALTYAEGTAPAHGTLSITAATGAFTYTPAADYNGPDSFTFTASDGTLSGTGTVTLTVTPVNDAPVAANQTLTTAEDTALTGILTATDVDGDPITYAQASAPAHGTLTIDTATGDFVYTPDADFFGSDSFTFTASDGVGMGAGTVTLTVTPLNDAPLADDQSLTMAEETALTGTLTATDVDGDPITYAEGTAPAHGTLTIDAATGDFTYTPAAGYNGPDSFTFTASDGTVDSNVATVTITVTPVNDAPVVDDQTLTTAEETALNGTLTATDVDGDPITYAEGTAPAHGTLTIDAATGDFTYTPAAGYNGPDSFTFTASDGTLSDTGTVNITVTPVNDAPVAVDQTLTTAEDTALTGTLNATDVDGDSISYAEGTAPAHGSVEITAATGAFTYTPAAGYNGPDSFTFTASDGELSGTGTVTITVTPVNDVPLPPIVDNATWTAKVANELVIDPFTDPDSDPLTYTATLADGSALPVWLTFDAAALTFSGTPANSDEGVYDLKVVASDGRGGTAEVTFTLTVVSSTLKVFLPLITR